MADWWIEDYAAGIEAREEAVTTWAAQLVALCPGDPHLVIHDCGHARVPKLEAHQHVGGRPVYTVRDAHARGCARHAQDARPGRVGNGRERYGTVAAPPAPEGAAPLGANPARGSLGESLIANGMKPEIVGRVS